MRALMPIFLRTVIFVLAFTTACVFAQEQQTEQDDSSNAQKATEQNSDQQTQEGTENTTGETTDPATTTASQDTFVPSEEISEDLSVSFPVDI